MTADALRRRIFDWLYDTYGGHVDVRLDDADALIALARRPPLEWPPDNPDPGKVGYRIEAWPHDPGANGEDYHSGHLPAAEVARALRNIADRCERYWADPECPWAGEPGHTPAPPPLTDEERAARDAAQRAKAAAYAQETRQ
jgi:hypothetical protein